MSSEDNARGITMAVLEQNGIKGIAGVAVANQIVDSLAEVDLIVEDEPDRLAGILALCDRWDVLTKGETPTTKQIRDIALGREGRT